MDALSNVDRLVVLLRQQLERRDRAGRAVKSSKVGQVASDRAGTTEGVSSDLILTGAADDQLQRAIVELLLTEQFGETLVNDVRFQHVVDRVTCTLAEDFETRVIFDASLAPLRAKIQKY